MFGKKTGLLNYEEREREREMRSYAQLNLYIIQDGSDNQSHSGLIILIN